MLSSSTASTPSASASSSCASVSTSTSILTRWPTAALARSDRRDDAARHRDVIVLDQHRVVEAEAVIDAAAGAHRIFFDRAQAGVVLRVQTMLRLRAGDAATMAAVADAMPLSRQRKFSATRSAVRMPRAGPETRAMVSPGADRAAVGLFDVERDARIEQREGEPREIEAGDHAGLAGDQRRRDRAAGGAIASVVMSPARPRSSSRAARTIGSIRVRGRGARVMVQAVRI